MLEKPGFLRHIHYFRAVAILFVVISHVFLPPWIYTGFRHPVYSYCFFVFTNATVFFVLISGFLFHYVNDNAGFRYWAFLKKKTLYVYLPMLVMSLPMMVFVLRGATEFTATTARDVAFALAAGRFLGPYWYIPFIMLVFALSPLIRWFIRLRWSAAITIAATLAGFFFFPRTFDLWPSVVPYFFPLFVLGAIMSHRYDQVQRLIAERFGWFGLLAALCVPACVFLPSEPPRWTALPLEGLDWLKFNLSVVAGVNSVYGGCFKVFLAVFFWGILIKFEHRESKLLDRIATYSFGIYFVHSYFLQFALDPRGYNLLWPNGWLSVPVTLAYCLLVPLLSLGVSMAIKLVFRRYARYIAGV